MFIELTTIYGESTEPCLVNMTHIVRVYTNQRGGSILTLNGQGCLVVRETPEEIQRKLRGIGLMAWVPEKVRRKEKD